MRKTLSAVLALVLAVSMGTVAFAEKTFDQSSEEEKQTSVTVKYDVAEEYSVTIPDGIVDLSKATKDKVTAPATVSASEVKLKSGNTLTISVSSLNSWTMQNADDASKKLNYNLYWDADQEITDSNKETTAATNSELLTIAATETTTATQSKTTHLAYELASDAPVMAGTYSDTLTFTVTVGA